MEGRLSAGSGGVPRQLVGTATLLTAVVVGETVVRASGWLGWFEGSAPVFTGVFLVGVVTTLPFVIALGYAGVRLPGSDIDPARYGRIRWWAVGVAVGSVAFNLVLIAVIGAASLGMFVAWVRWSVAVGAGVGLAVGVSEARAVQRSVETARAEFRAEHIASQRDFLDYLNGLLRHEILNATQVIAGNAEALTNDFEPGTDPHDRGETIHRQSRDVTSVIENVRELLNATQVDRSLEPIDAAAVARKQVETADCRYEDAEFETDLPDRALVEADTLLGRVFGNLLANAVEHNDGSASVSVAMTVSEGTVTVRVADDGPGVPRDQIPSLFDRPDTFAVDHGIGLYLAAQLVEQYRGHIDLAENGDDGAVFRVRLPCAPDSDSRRPGRAGDSAADEPATTP